MTVWCVRKVYFTVQIVMWQDFFFLIKHCEHTCTVIPPSLCVCVYVYMLILWMMISLFLVIVNLPLDFPGSSVVKNLPDNVEDVGLIPVSGRSPRKGNGNPLQYSCLGNPLHSGAWKAVVCGVTKELNMTYLLNNNKVYHWGQTGYLESKKKTVWIGNFSD